MKKGDIFPLKLVDLMAIQHISKEVTLFLSEE